METNTVEKLLADLGKWVECARRWEGIAGERESARIAAQARVRDAEDLIAHLRIEVGGVKSERDAALAAQRKAEQGRDCWLETAREESRNRDYYRGLVQIIGGMFGVAARTQDDGGIVEDVLCAKVPELVEALKRGANEANGMLQAIADEHRQIDVGMSLQDAALLVAARVKKAEQSRDAMRAVVEAVRKCAGCNGCSKASCPMHAASPAADPAPVQPPPHVAIHGEACGQMSATGTAVQPPPQRTCETCWRVVCVRRNLHTGACGDWVDKPLTLADIMPLPAATRSVQGWAYPAELERGRDVEVHASRPDSSWVEVTVSWQRPVGEGECE